MGMVEGDISTGNVYLLSVWEIVWIYLRIFLSSFYFFVCYFFDKQEKNWKNWENNILFVNQYGCFRNEE